MFLQCAKDRSCFGNWAAKARVLHARHAAVPVAPPTAFGARSDKADQYSSVCEISFFRIH